MANTQKTINAATKSARRIEASGRIFVSAERRASIADMIPLNGTARETAPTLFERAEVATLLN
jgi:hypothetical protein